MRVRQRRGTCKGWEGAEREENRTEKIPRDAGIWDAKRQVSKGPRGRRTECTALALRAQKHPEHVRTVSALTGATKPGPEPPNTDFLFPDTSLPGPSWEQKRDRTQFPDSPVAAAVVSLEAWGQTCSQGKEEGSRLWPFAHFPGVNNPNSKLPTPLAPNSQNSWISNHHLSPATGS